MHRTAELLIRQLKFTLQVPQLSLQIGMLVLEVSKKGTICTQIFRKESSVIKLNSTFKKLFRTYFVGASHTDRPPDTSPDPWNALGIDHGALELA